MDFQNWIDTPAQNWVDKYIKMKWLCCRLVNSLINISVLRVIVMSSQGTGNSLLKMKHLELSRQHLPVSTPISSPGCNTCMYLLSVIFWLCFSGSELAKYIQKLI
jgi:hypothetical protein